MTVTDPLPADPSRSPSTEPLLDVRDLQMYFPVKSSGLIRRTVGHVQAVDGVLYFWFPNGQGESGIFRTATPRMLGMGTGRNWNTVLKLADMVGLAR